MGAKIISKHYSLFLKEIRIFFADQILYFSLLSGVFSRDGSRCPRCYEIFEEDRYRLYFG